MSRVHGKDKEQMNTLIGDSMEFKLMEISSNGKYLVVSMTKRFNDGQSNQFMLKLINLEKKEVIESAMLNDEVTAACFSHDTRFLVYLTQNGKYQEINMKDMKTGKLVINTKFISLFPSDSNLDISRILFARSAEGNAYLLAAVSAHTARFFNFLPDYPHPLKVITSKNPFFPTMKCVTFLDGGVLLIGCEDGSVFSLDSKDMKTALEPPETHTSKKNGYSFIGYYMDTKGIILSSSTEQFMFSLNKFTLQTEIRFTSDAKFAIAASSNNGKLIVGVTKEGEILYSKVLKGTALNSSLKTRVWESLQSFHVASISLVSFESHQGLFATFDKMNILRVWDIVSNRVLNHSTVDKPFVSLQFHITGQFLLTGDGETIRQLLITPNGFTCIRAIKVDHRECKYNDCGSIIMSYQDQEINFYQTRDFSLLCRHSVTKQIRSVQWAIKVNFVVHVIYQDLSNEWIQLSPSLEGYRLVRTSHNQHSVANQKVKYLSTGIIDSNGLNAYPMHSMPISGIVETINDGFISYGQDGNLFLFNPPNLAARYSKRTLIFDEVFIKPSDIRNLEIQKQALKEELRAMKRGHLIRVRQEDETRREQLEILVSLHKRLVSDKDQESQKLEMELSRSRESHEEIFQAQRDKNEKTLEKSKQGNDEYLDGISEKVSKTFASLKIMEKEQEEKKVAVDAEQNELLEQMSQEFAQKVEVAELQIANITSEIDHISMRHQKISKILDKVVQEELDEIDKNYYVLTEKEKVLNIGYIGMKDKTAEELKQIVDKHQVSKEAVKEQKRMVKEVNDDIEKLGRVIQDMKKEVLGREHIMKEMEAQLMQAREILEANEQKCFLLESQVAFQQEQVKPRQKLAEETKETLEAMQAELKQLTSEQKDHERVCLKLTHRISMILEQKSRNISDIRQYKEMMSKISKDLIQAQECHDVKDELAAIQAMALRTKMVSAPTAKDEDAKMYQKTMQRTYSKTKAFETRLCRTRETSKKTIDTLNSQKIFLMEELADLKRNLY